MQIVQCAATVDGLTELDLNYPDHVGDNPAAIARVVADCGLQVSGLAMRSCGYPSYKCGAFTYPDRAVRREAIDLTKRGIDAARAMGAPKRRRLTRIALFLSNISQTNQGRMAFCAMRRQRCWRLLKWGPRTWASRLISPTRCMPMNSPPAPQR